MNNNRNKQNNYKEDNIRGSGSSGVLKNQVKQSLDVPNLVDVVKTKKGLKYLIKSDHKLKTISKYKSEDECLIPPKDISTYSIATEKSKEYYHDSDEELLEDIEDYLKDHIVIDDEFLYTILAVWVLHTWLIESFNNTPYLYFYGLSECGKSRAAKTLYQLCYRASFETSTTMAVLFRSTELFQPTIFIDEISLLGNQDMLDLIKARYQKEITVRRANPDKDSYNQILSFKLFGALSISTTNRLPDTIISRSIQVIMEKSDGTEREEIDEYKGKKLRDRLAAFRARHLDEKLKSSKRISSNGRLNEIYKPIQIILELVKPSEVKKLEAYLLDLERQRQLQSGDFHTINVIEAMIKCKNEGKVVNNLIKVDDITKEFNKGKHENEELTNQKIGYILIKIGFDEIRSDGNNYRCRIWDEEKIKKLAKRYSIEYPNKKKPPLYPEYPDDDLDEEDDLDEDEEDDWD